MTSDCRLDFPALQPQQGASPRLTAPCYLDNAATTQKPSIVVRAMEDYYRLANANPYRGEYRASVESTKLYEGSRRIVAEFIGADADEVVFTKNATESINLIAYAYALGHLQPGDEIALPVSEHHSNLVVWQYVANKTGARLVFITPDADGRLPDSEIRAKIGPRTRIVTLAQVSNVLGIFHPLDPIIRHAHAQGAIVVADCAQSVAHRPLDVHGLDLDFAAFSAHKMYGPMGIGVLYAKREILETLHPFQFGGEMIDVVQETSSTFERGPKRFEAGTPNVAGAIGLAAAIDYMENTVGFGAIIARERDMTAQLLDRLRLNPDVQIHGCPYPDEDRLVVVAFTVKGVHPQDVALALDSENIAIRTGTHCAQPLHRRLGIESSCRVSPCFYNTPEEIDRFLDALGRVRRTTTRKIMSMFP